MIEYVRLQRRTNIVRILPNRVGQQPWFHYVKHWIKYKNDQRIVPVSHSLDDECIFCKLFNNPELTDKARVAIRPIQKKAFLVIDKTEEIETVRILECGRALFDKIQLLVANGFTPWDAEIGFDIKIEFERSTRNFRYDLESLARYSIADRISSITDDVGESLKQIIESNYTSESAIVSILKKSVIFEEEPAVVESLLSPIEKEKISGLRGNKFRFLVNR